VREAGTCECLCGPPAVSTIPSGDAGESEAILKVLAVADFTVPAMAARIEAAITAAPYEMLDSKKAATVVPVDPVMDATISFVATHIVAHAHTTVRNTMLHPGKIVPLPPQVPA
jgi:hypothetical protein